MARKKIRVLQHIECLARAGVETWLVHVLRNIDRSRYQLDFLARSGPGRGTDYYSEVRELGSEVFYYSNNRNLLRFARRALHVLETHGPYDVVHSHLGHYDGFMLAVSAAAGVKIRISHSHSDARLRTRSEGPAWKLYRRLGQALIAKYATHRLAASSGAAESLFGPKWQSDSKTHVLYCGIDLKPFSFETARRATVRACVGIPEEAIVIGHVGRFEGMKNHEFLLRVAEAACRMERKVWFLLVGGGSLRPKIEAQVAELGLSSRVVFLDPRPDVPEIMMYALDAFVLPSLYEGLPMVLIEAQAANLPALVSSFVTRECEVVPGLFEFVPLSVSPECWAGRLLAKARTRDGLGGDRNPLFGTQFDIGSSVKALSTLYSSVS